MQLKKSVMVFWEDATERVKGSVGDAILIVVKY